MQPQLLTNLKYVDSKKKENIQKRICLEKSDIYMGICSYDTLYQENVKVKNSLATSKRITIHIPVQMINHMDLLPRTAVIQSNDHFVFSLKLLPRASIACECEFFDRETSVLQTTLTLCVSDGTKLELSVSAILTGTSLLVEPNHLNLSVASEAQAVIRTFQLTNDSLLKQKYAFINLPENVFLDMPVGVLLPKETIKLQLVFDPFNNGYHFFELICKNLKNKSFRMTCEGLRVTAPLTLSHTRLVIKPTNYFHHNLQTFYLFNNTCEDHDFEWGVELHPHLVIKPAKGRVLAMQRQLIWIRHSPYLEEYDIFCEARKLLHQLKERNYQESEKINAIEMMQRSNEAIKLVEQKEKNDKEEAVKDEWKPQEDYIAPTLSDIKRNTYVYHKAKEMLQSSSPFSFSSLVHCSFAPSGCPFKSELTQVLEVTTTTIRPEIVILPENIENSSFNVINFGEVSLCEREVKTLSIINVSECPVELSTSRLNTIGVFTIVNSLRFLDPFHLQKIIIAFQPKESLQYFESFSIEGNLSKVGVMLQGKGVCESVKTSIISCSLDFGNVLKGEVVDEEFQIINGTKKKITYSIFFKDSNAYKSWRFDSSSVQGEVAAGAVANITISFTSPTEISCDNITTSSEMIININQKKFKLVFLSACVRQHLFYLKVDGCELNTEIFSSFKLFNSTQVEKKFFAMEFFCIGKSWENIATTVTKNNNEKQKDVEISTKLRIAEKNQSVLNKKNSDNSYEGIVRKISIGCSRTGKSSVFKKVEWYIKKFPPSSGNENFEISPIKSTVDCGKEEVMTVVYHHTNPYKPTMQAILCLKGDVTLEITFQFLTFYRDAN